ncbi:MAG TPA: hypothetical protein VNJ08_10250 [Bacteriovoracaceae bacterium]|nr:hypothetical protein [Bacteriovoracaceae bacterium]
MKAIYVNRYEKQRKHRKWPYVGILLLASLLIIARVAAPVIAKNLINQKGADGKGYQYRVADVSMNILRGEINLSDLKVFNQESMVSFVEAPLVKLNFQWAELIRGEHIFELKVDQLNLILSKALSDEIQRIKDQSTNNTGSRFYLDKIVVLFERIYVIEADETNSRTILSLMDSKVSGKELAMGEVNIKSEFSLDGKIAEGGSIDLKGKTIQKKNSTPWTIQGKLTNILPDVLEKLTGNKLPIDITKTNLNANIVARSQAGQIKGTLTPDITEFNLREEKKSPWGDIVVKIKKYDLENTSASEEGIKFDIPFIVRDHLSLNIDETINKVKSQVKSKTITL